MSSSNIALPPPSPTEPRRSQRIAGQPAPQEAPMPRQVRRRNGRRRNVDAPEYQDGRIQTAVAVAIFFIAVTCAFLFAQRLFDGGAGAGAKATPTALPLQDPAMPQEWHWPTWDEEELRVKSGRK